MRRKKEDAEKTRKSILEAALEVFHIRGVSSASLIEIAQKAGVTRGAVYWHFKDKQDLYFALYNTMSEEFQSRPEDFGKRHYAELDEFIANIKRPLDLLGTNPRFQKFISIVYSRTEYVDIMKPIIDNEQQKQLSLVEAYKHALSDLQKRGCVAEHVDYKQFAYILYSFINGAYDSWSFDPDLYPSGFTPDILLEELFNSIRPETYK